MSKIDPCDFFLATRITTLHLVCSWKKTTHVTWFWLSKLHIFVLTAHEKRLSNLYMGKPTHVTSFDFRNCNFNFKAEVILYFYIDVATKFLFPESNVASTSNKSIHFSMNCITCWIHILIFVFFFIFLLPDF